MNALRAGLAVILALGLCACDSSSPVSKTPPASVTEPGNGSAPSGVLSSCPNRSTSVVSGTPSYTYERGCILSFDGTPIVYNLFEPLNPAPQSLYAVLNGPGWGNAGATTPSAALLAAGYAVMTWDPRGMGQSGGFAEGDAPWIEGRDVSALIDQVLTGRPEIAIDLGGNDGQPAYRNDSPGSNSYGQPVVAMFGASYGGAIGLSTSAIDNRIKAIVAEMTWSDLSYSFFPNGVVKLLVDLLLLGSGTGLGTVSHLQGDVGSFPSIGGTGGLQVAGGLSPDLIQAGLLALAQGYADPSTQELFRSRSLVAFAEGTGTQVPRIPTLLFQGLSDVLFNGNAAVSIRQIIKSADPDTPVKMFLQCDGHTGCKEADANSELTALNGGGQTAPETSPLFPGMRDDEVRVQVELSWLEHYVHGRRSDDGVPAEVVYQDQTGNFHPLPVFPTPANPGTAIYQSTPLAGTFLINPVPSGLLPLDAGCSAQFPACVLSDAATSGADPGQITVALLTAPADRVIPVVGIGHVNATIKTSASAVSLFFRLIDTTTQDVICLQTQPLRVTADNPDISLDLAAVAYLLPASHTLALQVSTSTTSFAPNRETGTVTISDGTVMIPVLQP